MKTDTVDQNPLVPGMKPRNWMKTDNVNLTYFDENYWTHQSRERRRSLDFVEHTCKNWIEMTLEMDKEYTAYVTGKQIALLMNIRT